MKKNNFPGQWFISLLFVIFASFMLVNDAVGQNVASDSVYYVYRNNGKGIYALPDSLVKSVSETATEIGFLLLNDSLLSFKSTEVDSVSRLLPNMPKFTVFKINDKYNYDLDNDVFCVIDGNRIYGDMGSMLGKDLRPSFETDREAIVYVDSIKQQTRVSRVRFDDEVTYIVSDGTSGTMLDRCFVKAEIKEDSLIEVKLTEDMLETNAPSASGHGLDCALDGDPTTFFHSTNSSDTHTYEKLPLDSCPYIDIALSKRIDSFLFYYMTRHDTDERQPLSFNIYTSNNKSTWTLLASFSAEDGIPQSGKNASFLSPLLDAGRLVKYIRIEMSKANYKNYLCLAELRLYQLYEDDSKTPEDYYQYYEKPIGREYKVDLRFRADTADVPRIDIDIDGGATVTSKNTWLNAKFTLHGNGMYESVEDSVLIKGRGNSSWNWPKKPYTLKFDEKIKLCGLRSGKRWNLMSNYQDVTEMMNAVIFKAGRMVQSAYQPHSIPIELYVNGKYYGCYTLTEHVGIHNNCVDEDDFSLMLELDSYYDETYKFYSTYYNLPVNVKNPDFSEEGCPLTLSEVKTEWGEFEDALRRKKDISSYLNIDSFAKFMVMNDLSGNTEINHPKSTFLYKPTGGDKYIFGPGWDFDWGFGYQLNGAYFRTYEYNTVGAMTGQGTSFFKALMSNEDVMRAYYFVWKKFMDDDGIEELLNWMDDYYAYAEPSYEHSALQGLSNSAYATYYQTFKTWLKNRANYIFENLTAYDDPLLGIDDGLSSSLKESDDNGISVYVEAGVLHVFSNVETVLPMYRVDGTIAGRIKVEVGENVYPLAPRGTIIVNGKRVYLKPL